MERAGDGRLRRSGTGVGDDAWDGGGDLRLDHAVSASVLNVEHGDLSAWGTSWSVRGTSGDDVLLASGSRGTVFTGLRGDDTFMGSSYDDTFRGGPGQDHALDMGAGVDTCVSVETVDGDPCETVTP